MVCQPQYLLICDSNLSLPAGSDGNCEPMVGQGKWHFVLERLDGSERLEAMDVEPAIHRDRIALLAVVRGLEALEYPSHVRLLTTSRYVERGMRFGLPNWREANYLWESFGALKPIRNSDLWQRVSSAMQYHEISCRFLIAGTEMAESILIQRRRLMGTGRQVRGFLANSHPNRLVDPPNRHPIPSLVTDADIVEGDAVTGARAEIACLSENIGLSLNCDRPKVKSQGVRAFPTLDRGVQCRSNPTKRQWWDMAAVWVERAQRTAAMA